MKQHELKGVWTALITPFHDQQDLDLATFDKLLQKQIDAKVTGVVLSGTTGESPTLQVQEKLTLIKRARAYSQGQLKIMAGSGCNNTQQTVELSKLCVDAGADALLVVTPPYNRPSLEGLKKHYCLIGEAIPSSVPVVLYHVPGRTAHSIPCQDLAALCASHPSIAAVKEASGNPILFARCIHHGRSYPHPPLWLSGDDQGFLATLSVGGTGIISVLTNVFPQAFVALYDHFRRGNMVAAQSIHHCLFELIDTLFLETNPIPIKALLAHLHWTSPILRAPLVPAQDSTLLRLKQVYERTEHKLKSLLEQQDPPS